MQLRQGAVEISVSANLVVAVNEEGVIYAVDEHGVNGDGATARDVRAGNGVQPEIVRAAASLLISRNGAGTRGRGRWQSRSSRSVRGERGVVCARRELDR